jgi:predicted transcriptional regulator
MTVQTLNREMYSEADAARLLGVSQSSLNYWLEGGVRRGKIYRPVIRVEARGGRAPVT